MIPHILAVAREALAAGFAIAVAMAVLGTFLLRWYRMRQEYLLLRLAMEKGIAPPTNPTLPQWLISLRQGVLIVTLGVAIAVIGGIGWHLGFRAQQTQSLNIAAPASTALPEIAESAPPPPPGETGQREPGRRGGPGPGLHDTPPPPPRPRDAAREARDRAEAQVNISMSMVVAGIILVLLGAVRIAFVPAEKRFATAMAR